MSRTGSQSRATAFTDEGLERAKNLFDRGILSAEDYDDVKLAWMNSLGD